MDNPHGIEVHLHPVAAFSIVDSHERRGKDNQRRVVGSLLGTINKGVYEVPMVENWYRIERCRALYWAHSVWPMAGRGELDG